MQEYLSEFLLVLSVIGAPIVLGALLFYGMTLSERRRSERADRETKRVYAEEERSRRSKEREAERSPRALDILKRRTGMTG
ncbi:hypothetical protein [Hyphomicrobium sp. 99]|uniref:hypothetical protein n=1 Tax=Hyphomicrobium sp. 99 TaxID=1163419 RepID=UPI0005F87D3E|nr:hypothetical protein [Hyphomicrobium sp. 99]